MLVTMAPRTIDKLIKSGKTNRFQDCFGVQFTAKLIERQRSHVLMELPNCATTGKMHRNDFKLIVEGE